MFRKPKTAVAGRVSGEVKMFVFDDLTSGHREAFMMDLGIDGKGRYYVLSRYLGVSYIDSETYEALIALCDEMMP